MSEFNKIGTNHGHGHVWERPDGVKALCGGPAICRACAADAALLERWRRVGAQDASAHAGPIDPAVTRRMNAVAAVLDELFNGKDCKPGDKKVGFFLTTFEFNTPGRFNYISNADKLDVHAMLREVTARLEGRLVQTPGTRQ